MAITPLELVQAVAPKIRDNGWAYYFVPGTVARGAEIGLDVVTFYVMGRGGALGDVDWQVVHSAFGYFKPSLVRDAWTAGSAKVSPREAAQAHMACCHELGRQKLGHLEGLGAFNEAAAAVHEAAPSEGLALYAGFKGFPLADDAPARAMQLVATLREFRGSVHLLAVIASGLSPVEAHYGSRPEAFQMFGWDESEVPAMTEEHEAKRKAAEALTDKLVVPAFSVLDEAGATALMDGIDTIDAALKA